jgi:hypothetical protein
MAPLIASTKRSELEPTFDPAGDAGVDRAAINAFYAPVKGKNEAQFEHKD